MGTFSCLANCSICAMNALVIGSINALDAKRWPRWNRKKLAMPPARCNAGTYTFKYIRSIPSTSNVTCSWRTSATDRDKLILAPARLRSLGIDCRFGGLNHWRELLAVLHCRPEPSLLDYARSSDRRKYTSSV